MPTLSIVGAAGTVGRVVVKQLLAADESLRVVALLRKGNAELAGLDRCDVIEGGIFDSNALERAVKNCDLVINFAARNPAGADEDWAAREDFFLLNGLGAGLVGATAQRHQVALIHFSTVSVYETAAYSTGRLMTEQESMPCLGEQTAEFYERTLGFLSKRVSVNNSLIKTDSLLVDDFKRFLAEQSYPRSTPIYGLSKLIGEMLALSVCRKVCCIRMSDVYGRGHESRGVIIDHLRQLGRVDSLSVDFGFRNGIYFLFIDDVARLLRLLVDRSLSEGSSLPRVMNFCGQRIDPAEMRSHLQDICRLRRVECATGIAPLVWPQFDRRYSSEVLDRCFPAFAKTDFRGGLRLTADVPGAASKRSKADSSGATRSPIAAGLDRH